MLSPSKWRVRFVAFSAMSILALTTGVTVASGMHAANADLPTITVSVYQDGGQYASLYLARYEGFFRRCGVNVQVQNLGTLAGTTFLAGRTDLSISGANAVLSFANAGKLTKVIYDFSHGIPDGITVKYDSPYKTLMDLSGATVASFATGSGKSQVQALSDMIVAQGGKPIKLSAVSTPTGSLSSLVAGGVVDATIDTPEPALPLINLKKVRWVPGLEPNSVTMQKTLPHTTVGVALYGLADTLASKAASFTGVVCGLRLAQLWLSRHTIQLDANIMHAQPEFSQIATADLTGAMALDKFTWNPTGFITAPTWDGKSIPVWATWGLGLDFSSPLKPMFSHSNRVDMSYWNGATRLVNKYKYLTAPKKK